MPTLWRNLSAWKSCCLAAALPVLATAQAQSPNISGDWWYLLFDVPYELRFEGDKLVGGNEFRIATQKINYSGARFQNLVNGAENGPFSITPELEVRHQTSNDLISAYMNKSHDIMIWAGAWREDPSSQVRELTFSMKPPASFAVAQLAGTWDTAQLEVPTILTAPFLAPGSPLVGTERFASERLFGLTVDANGIVSVPGEGTVGVFIQEQGLPVLVTDGEKDGFFLNAAKDVMIRHKPDVTDQTGLPIYLTTVAVKRAQGLSVSDVVGQWHYAELSVPRWMTVQGSAGNRRVTGNGDFESLTAQVSFCASGKVRLSTEEGEATGSWKLNGSGLVEVTTDSGLSTFSINQSKSFMAGLTAGTPEEKNYTGLIALVKYSDAASCENPTPLLSLEKSGNQWQIVWSGGILQSAASLAGPWTDATGEVSPMILNTSVSAQYYRVKSP